MTDKENIEIKDSEIKGFDISYNVAAIDIGSNGARLLIKNFFRKNSIEEPKISRVMYMRVPLRLGKDVFTLGKISKEREEKMREMLKAFKHIMRLNDVISYRACATSAMRDAENGDKVLKRLYKKTGIKVEIIKGQEEARLLCNNMIENSECVVGDFAYIDVGGGSTEISLIHNGLLAHSKSYNIGTLRMLSGKVSQSAINEMKTDLSLYSKEIPDIHLIGSGGNINKLFKLTHTKKDAKEILVSEIRDIYEKLKPLSIEERIEQFGLKTDRADVIIPAAEIYMTAAEALGCTSIHVPNISLADSIVDGIKVEQFMPIGEDEEK
mgnify:CR=1 FL=1